MVEFKIELEGIDLKDYTLNTEENAVGKKIDSVTDGVEFVPYWRTVQSSSENGITVIVNDAIRLAIIHISRSYFTKYANTWYLLGHINEGYKPVRPFITVAHITGGMVKIRANGEVQCMSPQDDSHLNYICSIVYPYFNNHVDPPEE